MNEEAILNLMETIKAAPEGINVGNPRWGLIYYTLMASGSWAFAQDLNRSKQYYSYRQASMYTYICAEYLGINLNAAEALFHLEPWRNNPQFKRETPGQLQVLRVLQHLHDEGEVNWYV